MNHFLVVTNQGRKVWIYHFEFERATLSTYGRENKLEHRKIQE
jgi:hypothetical protein